MYRKSAYHIENIVRDHYSDFSGTFDDVIDKLTETTVNAYNSGYDDGYNINTSCKKSEYDIEFIVRDNYSDFSGSLDYIIDKFVEDAVNAYNAGYEDGRMDRNII